MSGWGNVRSGKCYSGEMSNWESALEKLSVRGNGRRESVSQGIVLGEVPVGEVPSRGTLRIPNILSIPLTKFFKSETLKI